jgi:hypothetical protein
MSTTQFLSGGNGLVLVNLLSARPLGTEVLPGGLNAVVIVEADSLTLPVVDVGDLVVAKFDVDFDVGSTGGSLAGLLAESTLVENSPTPAGSRTVLSSRGGQVEVSFPKVISDAFGNVRSEVVTLFNARQPYTAQWTLTLTGDGETQAGQLRGGAATLWHYKPLLPRAPNAGIFTGETSGWRIS